MEETEVPSGLQIEALHYLVFSGQQPTVRDTIAAETLEDLSIRQLQAGLHMTC